MLLNRQIQYLSRILVKNVNYEQALPVVSLQLHHPVHFTHEKCVHRREQWLLGEKSKILKPELNNCILGNQRKLMKSGLTDLKAFNCQSERFFHKSAGLRNEDDAEKPNVKGVVFVIPNPLDWLWNKWHLWNIKQLDPQFSLDDFMLGAIQAVTIVTKYLSQQDYDSLKGLLTENTIVDLKEMLHYDEERHLTNVGLEETDIVYQKAKTWKLVEEDNRRKKLMVDTCFVALKWDSDTRETFMYEIEFNFCRNYEDGAASDWVIDGVSRFQVREFQGGKPRKPL